MKIRVPKIIDSSQVLEMCFHYYLKGSTFLPSDEVEDFPPLEYVKEEFFNKIVEDWDLNIDVLNEIISYLEHDALILCLNLDEFTLDNLIRLYTTAMITHINKYINILKYNKINPRMLLSTNLRKAQPILSCMTSINQAGRSL